MEVGDKMGGSESRSMGEDEAVKERSGRRRQGVFIEGIESGTE